MILWAGGGATKVDASPGPGVELRMSAAGPAASLLAGMAFTAAALGIGSAHGSAVVLLLALVWLGHTNVLLAVCNLIPIMGMDGQRLLYGLLWWRTRDQDKSSTIAIRAGSAIGWAGLIGGAVLFLTTRSFYGLEGILFGAFAINGSLRKPHADVQVNYLL